MTPFFTIKSVREGFTFFEVMVALAIISIVLVSIYRLQSQTIQMNIRSRFDMIAPMLAQQKLGEISLDLKNAGSTSGNFDDDFQGYSWQVAVSEVSSDILGQIADDMRQIEVTIFFHNDDNQYRLREYRLLNGE